MPETWDYPITSIQPASYLRCISHFLVQFSAMDWVRRATVNWSIKRGKLSWENSRRPVSIKLRLMKYTDEPEACWIKVEFLRSSVRNWSEPWLQRWMKIFSTWGYKNFSCPQTHKKRQEKALCSMKMRDLFQPWVWHDMIPPAASPGGTPTNTDYNLKTHEGFLQSNYH